MNITMASRRGPGPTIAPRELQLIRSGVIPLSLTIYPLNGDKREGDVPLKCLIFDQYFPKTIKIIKRSDAGNDTKQLLQDAPIIPDQFWGPKKIRPKSHQKVIEMTLE